MELKSYMIGIHSNNTLDVNEITYYVAGSTVIDYNIFKGTDINCEGEYITYERKTLTQVMIRHYDTLTVGKRRVMVDNNGHTNKYVTLDKKQELKYYGMQRDNIVIRTLM